MIAPRTAALITATALAVVACGGGGDKASTTTTPTTGESTSSSFETTTTTIDPALQELLLVAEDLKDFKEQATTEPVDPDGSNAPTCGDPAIAPAGRALDGEPSVDGGRFVRGPQDAVDVSSSVVATTPEKAEAALKEVLEPKVVECLEGDFRTEVEKEAPAGTTVTFKTTSAASTVPGIDQAVLVSSTVTLKNGATTSTRRVDLVFLRKAGVILTIPYSGPTELATSAERQRIVAIAARKLAGEAAGTSTTAGASGSTTSTRRGATTSTRRSTSTTRQGSTTSSTRATTSTT